MTLSVGQLRAALNKVLIGGDGRPLVVSSALWPIARSLGLGGEAAHDAVLDLLLELGSRRPLLAMPCFATGYKNGICNLDTCPSTTGVLTESLRSRPGVRRTVSAFFSHAVQGPQAAAVVALRPHQAWGQGSFYDWCEQADAQFLMLGCHPTHCSYLHRVEHLMADQVIYRYFKPISGTVIHEQQQFPLTEELFVRSLSPEAIYDLTVLQPILLAGGMMSLGFDGAPISAMGALAMRDATLAAMRRNPLMLISNPEDFRTIPKESAR